MFALVIFDILDFANRWDELTTIPLYRFIRAASARLVELLCGVAVHPLAWLRLAPWRVMEQCGDLCSQIKEK